MPLLKKNFTDLFRVIRNGGAYRINKSGLFELMPANVARISYDPIALTARGITVEEGRTNLLLKSKDLTHTTWGRMGCDSVSVSPKLAPDGVSQAFRTKEATAQGGGHGLLQTSISFNKDAPYVLSTFASEIDAVGAAKRYVTLLVAPAAFGQYTYATFDIKTGKVTGTNAPSTACAGVETYSNGWIRPWLSLKATATSVDNIQIRVADASNPYASQTGDLVSGMDLSWPMLEVGNRPSSPIVTDTAALSRLADYVYIPLSSIPNFNPLEGTFIVTYIKRQECERQSMAFSLSDGSLDNRIAIFQNAGGQMTFRYVAGGVNYTPPDVLGGLIGSVNKAVLSYSSKSVIGCVNGGDLTVITRPALPVLPASSSNLWIGHQGGDFLLNGEVMSLQYLPTQISPDNHKAVTK